MSLELIIFSNTSEPGSEVMSDLNTNSVAIQTAINAFGSREVDEILNTQGVGPSFTLANTPIAGTVELYRGGIRITVGNGDYTITGTTILLAAQLGTGEKLTADYSH